MQIPYHGQWKQDQVLNEEVFGGMRNGSFVEIGCADPVHLSNSYFLEQAMGWRGLCIDARASACEKFRQMRSAQVVQAAIGEHRGKSIFLDFGVLGGLAKYMTRHEFETIEKWTTDHSKVNAYWVDVLPLADICSALPDGPVDLLMLDTEGSELAILRSMGAGVQKFRVLLVEANTAEARQRIAAYVGAFGFTPYKTVGADTIYLSAGFTLAADAARSPAERVPR